LDINNKFNSTDNADVSNMQESEMGIMSSSSTVRVHLETAMRAESRDCGQFCEKCGGICCTY
jgi:hypothetical protein